MAGYALQNLADASAVARIDMRVKFAFLLLASTLIFVWNSILLQAAFLAAVLCLMAAAGVSGATIRKLFAILLPALVLITVVQGLWSPFGVTPLMHLPASLPWLGGRSLFTLEGLLFGLVVCCRVLIPMFAFQLVFMTSEPNDIVLGLVRVRVPYRVAFLVSTTFRFVPLLLSEFEGIQEAQRLRGIDTERIGVIRRLVALGRMLVPVILISLTKAQLMEMALQSKAFSGSADRTYLHPSRERLTLVEKFLLAVFPLVLAGALFGRFTFGWGGTVLP